MLAAQQILSEGLGLVKSTVYLNTDERIATALLPIQSELEEVRSRLDAIEERRTDSSSNTLVQELTKLLDSNSYPTNGTSKMRKRIREIITELTT